MRLSCFLCFLLSITHVVVAQTAAPPTKTDVDPGTTVTFYAGGRAASVLSPFASTNVFNGCIFEQGTKLACITWRRYAVVKLPPGLHTFSASLSAKHGADNSQLSLLVESGKSYYLRTTTKHKRDDVIPVPSGVLPLAVPTTLHADKGFLELVTCEVAAKDTIDFAPADAQIAGKDWARRPRDRAPACPPQTP